MKDRLDRGKYFPYYPQSFFQPAGQGAGRRIGAVAQLVDIMVAVRRWTIWSTFRYPKSCAASALSNQRPMFVGLVRSASSFHIR